jgi:hypothetical protein
VGEAFRLGESLRVESFTLAAAATSGSGTALTKRVRSTPNATSDSNITVLERNARRDLTVRWRTKPAELLLEGESAYENVIAMMVKAEFKEPERSRLVEA